MAISFSYQIINLVYHFCYLMTKEYRNSNSSATIHQLVQLSKQLVLLDETKSVKTSSPKLQACFEGLAFQTRSFQLGILRAFEA